MSEIPADLLFAKSHEWVRLEPDGIAVIGISDYAQSSLGDITFIQLPAVGLTLQQGEVFGVVESVKAASDLYVPVAGAVVAVNDRIATTPEIVNRDPYGQGWLVRLRGAGSVQHLLDGRAYATHLG